MKDFWDMAREVIEESDVVIEVLDGRMPHQTRNKKAENMVRISKKPLLLVVNKTDMITSKTVKRHRESLQKVAPVVFVSTKTRRGITFLKKKIFQLTKKKSRRRYKWKPVSVGIIGYPNTGKSSLINALVGRKKTKVAAKPGHTRGIQWIKIDSGIRLVDTPGVIPFFQEDEVKQALIGVLDSSKIEYPEDVARRIVEMFLEDNKKALEKVYGIKVKDKNFDEIIDAIGTVRGMLKKGGEIDKRRVYLTLVNDWQKGKLLLKN
jgi:hypothetical protein